MQTVKTINLGDLLLSLSGAVDLASPEISSHQQRTAFIAWKICEAATLPEDLTKDIFTASLLHDVGAITVEEKLLIHSFETTDMDIHCRRGEILLKRIPRFDSISGMVRYHHREWSDWLRHEDEIARQTVLASQIIFLSDYIERLIERDRYILHQTDRITGTLLAMSGSSINPEILGHFMDFSRKEEFWLDLASPGLPGLLFSRGPLGAIYIDYDNLESISKLFRDIIDFKSPFTASHTSGVAACAEMLSALLGLSPVEIQEMKIAANLHDLGKLAIPNSILSKNDALTRDEFAMMKSHVYHTYNVINSITGLRHIAEWAAFHHERLDGSGYPFHHNRRNMSMGSRIMAVADIFTAITENRPYRDGMSSEDIIRIMRSMASRNFIDGKIVELLVANIQEIDAHVKLIQESAREFYVTRLEAVGI
jgi:HD-GYP domain-containing protein (c-di-GMP phosphodiesterase class II)